MKGGIIMEKTLAVAKFFNELYKSENGTDMDDVSSSKRVSHV